MVDQSDGTTVAPSRARRRKNKMESRARAGGCVPAWRDFTAGYVPAPCQGELGLTLRRQVQTPSGRAWIPPSSRLGGLARELPRQIPPESANLRPRP